MSKAIIGIITGLFMSAICAVILFGLAAWMFRLGLLGDVNYDYEGTMWRFVGLVAPALIISLIIGTKFGSWCVSRFGWRKRA